MAQISPFFDGLKQWEKKVYRKMWRRVRQFWTAEKWVRVTDDEKNVRFVGLNRPITIGEQMQSEGYPVDDSPIFQQVTRIENNIAEAEVDIIIEDAPDVINLQSEQFELLVQLAERTPELDVTDVIRASSLRNKDQIIERIESKRQQAMQPPPPEVQQMQIRKEVAEITKDEAQASKYQAEAEQTHIENRAVMTGYASPHSI